MATWRSPSSVIHLFFSFSFKRTMRRRVKTVNDGFVRARLWKGWPQRSLDRALRPCGQTCLALTFTTQEINSKKRGFKRQMIVHGPEGLHLKMKTIVSWMRFWRLILCREERKRRKARHAIPEFFDKFPIFNQEFFKESAWLSELLFLWAWAIDWPSTDGLLRAYQSIKLTCSKEEGSSFSFFRKWMFIVGNEKKCNLLISAHT